MQCSGPYQISLATATVCVFIRKRHITKKIHYILYPDSIQIFPLVYSLYYAQWSKIENSIEKLNISSNNYFFFVIHFCRFFNRYDSFLKNGKLSLKIALLERAKILKKRKAIFLFRFITNIHLIILINQIDSFPNEIIVAWALPLLDS